MRIKNHITNPKMPLSRYSFTEYVSTWALCVVALLLCIKFESASASNANYPQMAPLSQYLSKSTSDEIKLARSAAPASISDHADIMVLGRHGYHIVVKGSNGFVCLVERSWARRFGSTGFWYPKMRAPLCVNPVAMKSVEVNYLMRTSWVLSGMSIPEMRKLTLTDMNLNKIPKPGIGAMSYMMSKNQNLSTGQKGTLDNHWYPHLMFYFPNAALPKWGANLQGVPVFMNNVDYKTAVLYVLVPKWSDGTPSPATR